MREAFNMFKDGGDTEKLVDVFSKDRESEYMNYHSLKRKFVGRLFVKATGKPMEILAKLNEMASFAPDEEIELFEEIKFEPNVMCEHVDKKLTFRGSQGIFMDNIVIF